MGLDMYLTGERFFTHEHPARETKPFPLSSEQYRLAYWRKHPNLHGFIVETFAAGVDECQTIELTAEDLRTIIQAVKDRQLPHTEGFFFGTSEESENQIKHDAMVLEDALKWLEDEDDNVWRSVSYRASW